MKNILSIISIFFLISCSAKKAEPETTAEATPESSVSLSAEQLKNAQVETGLAEKSNIATNLRLNGSIDVPPQSMVSVSFPLGGYLKSTKLLPGMQVRKGEVLAIMEDAQFISLQQDYLVVKSKLALSEAEYQRQQNLNAGKASSDKVFQQAKSDYETQRINLRALAEKLRLIGLDPDRLTEDKISRTVSVYSPINGFVSKVDVNIGKYTAPTDVLFELVNTEDIHLALTVFEKDVSKLAIGQKVVAYTNDKPEVKHTAEIILVSKTLNEDHAAEVHCHFDRYDKTLLPGMFMNAEVAVKTDNAWLVPEAAVVRWQNEHFIFVEAGNGKFEMERVAIGVAQNGKQQVFPEKDLAGKNLALKNAYSLLMKMKNSAEE
jgi:cobalt-zinc-cadmium efflux system membrane fusion protein